MKASKKPIIGAALLLLLALAFASAQTPPPRAPQDEPILLTVTVTNGRGESVTGLKQDNFIVLVDKTPAKIVSFNDSDVPMSIGILFDASGSMQDPRHRASTKSDILKEALARLLELSNKSNEYFVIGFNYKPQLLLDWTYDTRVVIDKLTALQPQGNTAFYDACYLGVEKIMHGQYAKRAIILISDGQDNESHYTLKQLRDLVKESDTLIYSINVLINDHVNVAGGPVVSATALVGEEGQGVLNELAWISGSMTFYREVTRVKPAEVKGVFEVIANELRHQYMIGITPSNPAGQRKWHKIKINVSSGTNAPRQMKGISVRTREGYYGPSK